MTTSGNWSIGDGQTVGFLVDGNLTINGKINLTGSGLAFFIASGTITIASSVGVPPSSNTPVVEGLYVANGTLATGTSGSGTERFVGKGSFVAGTVKLQRDLGDTNVSTSAELFIYNPRLLFNQPEFMMDRKYFWQETPP